MIKYLFDTIKNCNLAELLNASPEELFLIKNFPDDDQLLETFLAPLGSPIQEDRNQKEGSVFHVHVENKDAYFTSYANSNLFFPLHTDGSDFETPPKYVAMLCVRPSEEGGESLFISLSELIANLPNALLTILMTKQWRFNTIDRTMITQTPIGHTICYNRLIMESYAELAQQELAILDELDRMCDQLTFRFKLKENDLIVFRNDLFLHGRTDFPLNSNRLLKRVRFQVMQ